MSSSGQVTADHDDDDDHNFSGCHDITCNADLRGATLVDSALRAEGFGFESRRPGQNFLTKNSVDGMAWLLRFPTLK